MYKPFTRLCNVLLHKSCLLNRGIVFTNTVIPSASNSNFKRWTKGDCKLPHRYDDIRIDDERRGLRTMLKQPFQPPTDKRRKNYLIRGPCLGEGAKLKHKQFGIIVLKGGWFKSGHFNLISNKINRFTKRNPVQAEWRVDAPYHAVTKHPLQAVMGGGKGKISHYVTPVKARQVIFELYGKAEFAQCHTLLRNIAMLLPVPAMAVDNDMLEEMYQEEYWIENENENFFSFREIAEKNMQGMRKHITNADLKYFGKMR